MIDNLSSMCMTTASVPNTEKQKPSLVLLALGWDLNEMTGKAREASSKVKEQWVQRSYIWISPGMFKEQKTEGCCSQSRRNQTGGAGLLQSYDARHHARAGNCWCLALTSRGSAPLAGGVICYQKLGGFKVQARLWTNHDLEGHGKALGLKGLRVVFLMFQSQIQKELIVKRLWR